MLGKWRTRLVSAIAAAGVVSGAAWAIEMRTEDEVNITGTYDQMVFAAGDTVTLNATATDDVFGAGDDVRATGGSYDHLFMAGGDLSLQDATPHDLFAAGGELDMVSGHVLDDFAAAGGRIKLSRDLRIDGDALIAGGNIDIRSPIGGALRAAGGTIYLNSAVTGDVYLNGRDIQLGPDAHIMGSLTHRGRNVTIDPSAQVDGQTTALEPPPEPDWAPLKKVARFLGWTFMFGMFLAAIVVAWAFPRLMNDSAQIIRDRPLSMLGLGVLIAFLTPAVASVLLFTVFGAPIALILFAALLLLWPIALIAAAYTLGMFGRNRMKPGEPPPSSGARVLWCGLAMLILIVLGMIPVVGQIVWWAAFLFGLAAVVVQAGAALSKQQTAPA
ncbi:hypothetical protein [Terricaulis sp.]|uniref:hypothetical protein n=1 Tax=Terricaulis sp. TaxID=2768686 RepID=UPI0037835BD4